MKLRLEMKRKLSVILLAFLLLLSVACSKKEEPLPPEEEGGPEEVVPEVPAEEEVIETPPYEETLNYEEMSSHYDEMKSQYKDYVGEIFFESGLIDLPFVQGASNDTYLRTDFMTGKYDSSGSIFMDYRNYLNDENVIIYGHYVYLTKDPSGTRMFTPLRFLTEEENYEENKYFYLAVNGELRKYEIAVVYICQLYDVDGYWATTYQNQYYIPNYDKDYFEEYKAAIYQQACYQTGVDITHRDKLVTLQTCIEDHEDQREIVVAKLVRTMDLYTGEEIWSPETQE